MAVSVMKLKFSVICLPKLIVVRGGFFVIMQPQFKIGRRVLFINNLEVV